MTNRRAVGSRYEEQAAAYLESRGYTILARNYHTRFGELDLVAQSPEGTIAAVEVKYRKSTAFGDPAEAVGPQKQRRMGLSFAAYLMRAQIRDRDLRFDVIAVYGDGRLVHIPNAFAFELQ